MKKILITLFVLTSMSLFGQKVVDTVKVYNVHCSYSDGNSYISWGGNWTSFYPAELCPADSKTKYINNYKNAAKYLDSKQFFWMKLYNTKDQLIYEGLKYSDCTVGKFICYWPNGQIKLSGEYGGYSYTKKRGFKIAKCTGKKKGEWIYFNEIGQQTDKIKY